MSEQNARNRKNGEKFEIKIVVMFKKRSDVLHVMHSAGSFGTWDIVVHFMDGSILYITAKLNGSHTIQERAKILKFMRRLKNVKSGKVRMECWFYKSTRKISKMKIKTESDVERLRQNYRVMAG